MSEAYKELERIFHPRSIAFVGVTTSNPMHWTRTFWDSARVFNFDGPVYAVNPRGGQLDGHKVCLSLDDVPGDIDYVIGTVAAGIAPEIVRKCAGRGVKAVHFCTAGFNETGATESAGLQEELVRLSAETGIRIIGPNCMGIYCPESRLSFDADFPLESGNIGLISQSGGNAIYIVREAGWRGVRFSKVISFGNACDLNECDFLEYLIEDPATSVIALYLEGVRDGARFLRLMERASREKTVVLLKGGLGEAGARATESHTASLAGNNATWEALCRQFNLTRPKNVEELVDILTTLYFMPDPGGRNVILIGPGGGASVLLTDEFERRGLRLPALPEKIREKLLGFTQLAGNMLRNPIDYSQTMLESDSLERAVGILTDWDEIDFCVGFFRPSQFPPRGLSFILREEGTIANSYRASHKPVAFICEQAIIPEGQKATFSLMQKLAASKIPVYLSFAAAAEALSAVVTYNERRRARRGD
ncbi:MAG: CoA-binding protein [Dehalococcoidia bacterium]|nr:CoA-binding protein [Dehalococcoidia bacterium]MDD5494001.1 CoA-binding protein [Dehalococcoidia bacterium]